MNKVYVVTSGQYSDYGIDAIFTTKELAEKFIDSFLKMYNEMEIEEWDLNPNEQHLKQNRKPYFLRINKNGNISDVEQRDSSFGFKQNIPVANTSYTHDKLWLNVECFADDEAHAVKIAGEQRARLLASDLWAK